MATNLFTNKIDFMKKEAVYPGHSAFNLLLMAAFSFGIIVQTGCNNSGAQSGTQAGQKMSTNWRSVDITFKPNTNEEWRAKSIGDIEKMLIKLVAPYTKEDKNFCPSIRVTKMPFCDSLRYQISVLNTYKSASGELQLLSKSATPCPPCPGYCPACDTMMVSLKNTYYIEKMVFEQPK